MPTDSPSAREIVRREKLEEDFAHGKFDATEFECLRKGLPGRRIFQITNDYLQLHNDGPSVIGLDKWAETFGASQVSDAYHLACRLVLVEKTDELLELYPRERYRSSQLQEALELQAQQPAPPSETS